MQDLSSQPSIKLHNICIHPRIPTVGSACHVFFTYIVDVEDNVEKSGFNEIKYRMYI